jgi:uncharacterized protein YyaL (SSP411 family)
VPDAKSPLTSPSVQWKLREDKPTLVNSLFERVALIVPRQDPLPKQMQAGVVSYGTSLLPPKSPLVPNRGEIPMPNRLIHEKSPYLLQHAHNPVDWYPWSDDAFNKARKDNKPIFLSIGYATCHWCHVMEHESFEDEDVARLLNQIVVAIKVDREERPDIDQVYMSVCQTLTGSGGWPLSIFLTPDGKPFFAGTYFPKTGRAGMPGFRDVLLHISRLWENQQEQINALSEEIIKAIKPSQANTSASPDLKVLDKAYNQLKSVFDNTWGGFGSAPKFPTPHQLTFLLRYNKRKPESDALKMVEKTLDSMRDGGIFDQIGFGFHRYSVDQRWLVPHFEKMLYDQAMLAIAYSEAYQVTANPRYAQVTREIFEYVLRDMADERGGFYSAEDADSEGEEGRFYVWTPKQIRDIIGKEQGDVFCRYYDITDTGNFEENRNIPHITRSTEVFSRTLGITKTELDVILQESRIILFNAREKRPHPFKDDKVLTSWNGLMIAALSKGYQALQAPEYLDAALKAADFILEGMRDDTGRLFRRFRMGERANKGYLDDYAFLVWGLLELYEASFCPRYFEESVKLSVAMEDLFRDEREGGFFFNGKDSEHLIVRDKQLYDGAIPSGNSVAALNFLRIGRMTGDTLWDERADRLINAFTGIVSENPWAYTQFLNAVDFSLGPSQEVVVATGKDDDMTRTMIRTLQKKFSPNRVLMLRKSGEEGNRMEKLSPFLANIHPEDRPPTVYFCENFACKKPITDLNLLKETIG